MPRERIATWPTGRANRWSTRPVETLAADRTISLAELEKYQAFSFDPGGAARNVVLPAVGVCAGCYLTISNAADAAEIITVQNAAAATIGTPTQAESMFLWCDGVSWFGLVGAQS